MKQMGTVPKEARPAMGKLINEAKTQLQVQLDAALARLEAGELAAQLGPAVDATLPTPDVGPGTYHPLTLVREEMCRILRKVGFTVADALAHTNIPFIYGVHFWREALGGDSDEGYFDEEGRPVPRAEFRYILSRAASVYANSQYTRSILQSVYGVRCPVIYSVPRELERRDEA
jgi:hypothetical protein